jgi:hypothetical protein
MENVKEIANTSFMGREKVTIDISGVKTLDLFDFPIYHPSMLSGLAETDHRSA